MRGGFHERRFSHTVAKSALKKLSRQNAGEFFCLIIQDRKILFIMKDSLLITVEVALYGIITLLRVVLRNDGDAGIYEIIQFLTVDRFDRIVDCVESHLIRVLGDRNEVADLSGRNGFADRGASVAVTAWSATAFAY